MKVYRWKWGKASIPNTFSGWASVAFSLVGIFNMIKGDANAAWNCIQTGLLFEVLDRLPDDGA